MSSISNTAGNKRLIGIMAVIVCLLLAPAIAMQFTNEVDWSSSDFVIMGILLSGTGLAIELILRNVRKTEARVIISMLILATFFLIWAELAVGVFGTPFAGS